NRLLREPLAAARDPAPALRGADGPFLPTLGAARAVARQDRGQLGCHVVGCVTPGARSLGNRLHPEPAGRARMARLLQRGGGAHLRLPARELDPVERRPAVEYRTRITGSSRWSLARRRA